MNLIIETVIDTLLEYVVKGLLKRLHMMFECLTKRVLKFFHFMKKLFQRSIRKAMPC